MNKEIPREYLRFNVVERLQHAILLFTFLLLAFSGWALKYPEIEQSKWWISMWGGPKIAGLIHRIAGVTLILNFLWHVLYLGYSVSTGRIKFRKETTVVPMPKDLFDFVQNIFYYFGISKEKPKFGRFNYLHKFDYWAVFWGMAIIGLSGLFLSFPVQASYLFPAWSLNWIWEVISVMHSDEALLAIVFILVIHFYNEHLKMENFPMSMLWITGKMPIEKMKHEHPLEYEIEFGEKDPGKSRTLKGERS